MKSGAGAPARAVIRLRSVVDCPMRLCMPIAAVLGLCLLVAQENGPTLSPEQALQNWRDSKAATLRDDFGELARYRDANAALKPPAPGEKRVAFLGDSITDYWKLADYF